MNYHPLLLRQLKKENIDPHSPELVELFNRLSKTYHAHDAERYTAQRAIEISSKEMRELRDRLEEERSYLQSILTEGLCIFNAQWTMINCNKTAQTILKILDLDLVRINFQDLYFYQDQSMTCPLNFSDIVASMQQNIEYNAQKLYFKDPQDKAVPVSLSVNPLPRVDGAFKGAILVIKDITEICQIEQSLQDALDEAYQSNEAKTLFLANISHELRTPMNAIMGYLQLLSNSPLNDLQKSHLKLTEESTHQLLELVNDILDFATIDSEQFKVQSQDCDLIEFLEHIKETYKIQCQTKGLNFNMLIAPNLPQQVSLDTKRFRQVLCNLIDNAIKFTPKSGSITVKVTLSNAYPNALEVKISDTGIGIATQDLNKIFDAFYQCEQGANRQYAGTGLGLSICHQLIHKMDGDIQVESTPQLGSTFTITLPYLSKDTSTYQLSHGAQTNGSPSQARILVVDDNATNLHVTKELLEISNYNVMTASGAQEALECLEKKPVDLIFMDCHMPGMDGFELTQHIRQNELSKGVKKDQKGYTKIIALTADAFESAKEKCFAVGMDGYVTKPFQLNDLQTAIKQELKKTHP